MHRFNWSASFPLLIDCINPLRIFYSSINPSNDHRGFIITMGWVKQLRILNDHRGFIITSDVIAIKIIHVIYIPFKFLISSKFLAFGFCINSCKHSCINSTTCQSVNFPKSYISVYPLGLSEYLSAYFVNFIFNT